MSTIIIAGNAYKIVPASTGFTYIADGHSLAVGETFTASSGAAVNDHLRLGAMRGHIVEASDTFIDVEVVSVESSTKTAPDTEIHETATTTEAAGGFEIETAVTTALVETAETVVKEKSVEVVEEKSVEAGPAKEPTEDADSVKVE